MERKKEKEMKKEKRRKEKKNSCLMYEEGIVIFNFEVLLFTLLSFLLK